MLHDNAYLLALDAADGAARWRRRVGDDTGASHLSTPIIADGIVYVGADDGHLYALEAATGQVRWRYKTGGAQLSTPIIAGDRLCAGANDGYIYALDPTGPTLLWRAFTDTSVAVVSRVTIAGGLHLTHRSPDDGHPAGH